MVPQLTVKSTVALPRLMPLLSVRVVLPLMTTGAAGLLITIPFQVTALPKVLVQFAGVVTVVAQIALSVAPGATPLTQLAPDPKSSALFVLNWSASAAFLNPKIIRQITNQR